MWIVTAVVDAYPVTVLGVALAGITCFRSNAVTELAASETVGMITTPSIATVPVDAVAAALASTMLVTTVVVPVVGTVYSVALDVVAAVRARALVIVAISYYLSLLVRIKVNLLLLG